MSSAEAWCEISIFGVRWLLILAFFIAIGEYLSCKNVAQFFRAIQEKRIIKRYCAAGLAYGHIIQEGAPSSLIFWILMRDFLKWEKKYIELGYHPLSIRSWVQAGALGFKYEHELRCGNPRWCKECKAEHPVNDWYLSHAYFQVFGENP